MAGNFRDRKSEVTRTPLREIIPLDSPLGINIEPTSACNFKCRFCIHGTQDKETYSKLKKGFMEFELYKKIIDDMKGFSHKPKTLKITNRGEPLLHPQIADMVAYAKKADVADDVSIITNASLLTPELSDRLIQAGLDVISVSIEGMSADAYKSIAGVDVNFEKMVDNIRYFYEHKKQCELYVKIIGKLCTDEERKKFNETFSPICDYYYFEHLDSAWHGYENLTDEERKWVDKRYEGLKSMRRKVCPEAFYSMTIDWNGICPACLADFLEEMAIGDAQKENVVDIWNGPKANALRYAQLTGKKDDFPVCQTDCFKYKDIHHVGNDPDNLDNLPQELIERFKPV